MRRVELMAIVTGQILGGMVVRVPAIQQVPTDKLIAQAADLAAKVLIEVARREKEGAPPPEPADPRALPSRPIHGL